MKGLWLARLARPDTQKCIGDLASRIAKWSKNDDRRLHRLMCFMNATSHYRLCGHIHDPADALELLLFVDADFAGNTDNAKSTSGGYLVLAGPNSWFPWAGASKGQSLTAQSTPEAELISLNAGLKDRGEPALDIW